MSDTSIRRRTPAADRAVVVAGDVTMDWHVAQSRAPGSDGTVWSPRDRVRVRPRAGGAALLAELVAAAAGGGARVHGPPPQAGAPAPDDPRWSHSWATWAPYPGRVPVAGEPPAWRVSGFIGLDPASEPPRTLEDDPVDPALVVLDDAALGFRDHPGAWPRALRDRRRRPWVLLKTVRPVGHGALWDHLAAGRTDRLVVVFTVDDLRGSEVQVSRELSWERTAQDLAWELVHSPGVNALSRAAAVIVSFGTAGGFLLSGGPGDARFRLIFDPDGAEGAWTAVHPGGMIGYTSCLAAALAREILDRPGGPDLEAGIRAGVAAMRRLHLEGYGPRGADLAADSLAFPVPAVARAIAERAGSGLATADVQDPIRFLSAGAASERPARPGLWSILEDRYRDRLEALVPRVAVEGVERALPGVPLGRFGALLTVDRSEIESFRAIGALVTEYARRGEAKPLSLAVFGAPGSGKSFGITQVARSLLPGRIEPVTFNLSQFGEPGDLHDALHQVRDRALSGVIPLVFWDEFDTGGLMWLRHFLAPMQDGSFQEGQIVHPVGRSIFVFAGGTSATLRDFGADLPADAFRALKGPDFASRLKGHVDVLGPNPRESGAADPFWLLRRAILLRALLSRAHPQLFADEVLRIDSGVLRAFLWTRTYRHGARSMESIVATSRLHGQPVFERSSLPPEPILDLHVDAIDFLALVQRLDLQGEILERLAAANHAAYREGLASRGATTAAAGMAFSHLPEEEKEQNRAAVRNVAAKLAAAGFVMVPARSDEPPFDFPGADLERLAEMEHARWARAKLAAGWRWATETDKPRRLHQALLPWSGGGEDWSPEELSAMGPDPLPEGEKEKDRDIVRGIPSILARAGYTVRRAGASDVR
jgi:hypothetical protein